eukprot:1598785-Rhodomonas_salina.4
MRCPRLRLVSCDRCEVEHFRIGGKHSKLNGETYEGMRLRLSAASARPGTDAVSCMVVSVGVSRFLCPCVFLFRLLFVRAQERFCLGVGCLGRGWFCGCGSRAPRRSVDAPRNH